MTETDRLRAALADIRATAAKANREKVNATLHLIMCQVDAALAQPQPTLDTRPVLTARQAEVLAYIRESIASRGYAPTVREIGARFGIASPNGVISTLRALRTKGRLRWVENKSRTLSVVEVA